MTNYFNSLKLREQLAQLDKCRFMEREEFSNGCSFIKHWNIVIIGCGAQGLNQGLNMRDSGLNISYALRGAAIKEQRQSWKWATEHGFTVGTFQELIPQADLVLNLTPDKQHTSVVNTIMPLMKRGATLSYSHGFNIVEEGMKVRPDITVIMVAPKCPGTEVREEYKRGFGVPTLIAVHPENNPNSNGLDIAKAYAAATGGDKAGVLESSFIAEVKSDLMGEQTILCGMLQTGAILGHQQLVANGIDADYACKLIQNGWETITEGLKHGGITNMMDRLSNPAKIKAYDMADELKVILRPLFEKHMDDIIDGTFSSTMMKDWANDDQNLLTWRAQTTETSFEIANDFAGDICEQEYYDHGIFLISMIKAGVELAFETMVAAGIVEESAYYESLHETPLIANCIARNKLYEMNIVISDTAEYGNYSFSHAAVPLLSNFVSKLSLAELGNASISRSNEVDNIRLIEVNDAIRNHRVEIVGKKLRGYMTDMKKIVASEQ
ncbi:ketol-acid reductoisomerase [Parashewanella spongiae]|uniref:Ketol-acid reductoisomerase (NADP(+)) n=1 Tax=Parashewanella spongiae TaxID=342950 RepID=A0A3A6TQ26_9GAMM|nr:ketol-acid reductoisomerase [Parashewanella spongiae]MCL1077721.1 ketol-acid reductoisomerase [Parashewanella spongiae]RJY18077.1 ketol-acid reductoisomerase [Parashewanella spongiae]